MLDINNLAHYDTPAFPVSVAAQAALVEVGTMRMWFQRERVKLYKGEAEYEAAALPEKPGLPRLLTFRTLLTLSTAAALTRAGVDVAEAYEVAKAWTYFGEGWDGNGPCPRDPAQLFTDSAFTVLIYHNPNHPVRVVRYDPGKGGIELQFSDLFGVGSPVSAVPRLVFLNQVDKWTRGICEGFLR